MSRVWGLGLPGQNGSGRPLGGGDGVHSRLNGGLFVESLEFTSIHQPGMGMSKDPVLQCFGI